MFVCVCMCVRCYAANSTGVSDIRSLSSCSRYVCTQTRTNAHHQRLHCSVRGGRRTNNAGAHQFRETIASVCANAHVAPEGRLAAELLLSLLCSALRCAGFCGMNDWTTHRDYKLLYKNYCTQQRSGCCCAIVWRPLRWECRIMFAH